MPKIVISYRRDDTAGITGRIYDRLRIHYGPEAVFRDIDAMPLGIDFRKHLEQALNDADAMVCIIGEKWLGKPKRGASRISDPTDYVRLEVETALRKGIPVVPVLIDDARMPKSDDLPESIRDLMFRNALRVNQLQDFDANTKRLLDGLDRTLASSVSVQECPTVLPVQEEAPVPSRPGGEAATVDSDPSLPPPRPLPTAVAPLIRRGLRAVAIVALYVIDGVLYLGGVIWTGLGILALFGALTPSDNKDWPALLSIGLISLAGAEGIRRGMRRSGYYWLPRRSTPPANERGQESR